MKLKYNKPFRYGDTVEEKTEKCTVECECGNTLFFVNWIEYPYTGGYCKLTCNKCGNIHILIDDYA